MVSNEKPCVVLYVYCFICICIVFKSGEEMDRIELLMVASDSNDFVGISILSFIMSFCVCN